MERQAPEGGMSPAERQKVERMRNMVGPVQEYQRLVQQAALEYKHQANELKSRYEIRLKPGAGGESPSESYDEIVDQFERELAELTDETIRTIKKIGLDSKEAIRDEAARGIMEEVIGDTENIWEKLIKPKS